MYLRLPIDESLHLLNKSIMKKILFLLLATSLTVASCEKSTLSRSNDDSSISGRQGRGVDDPVLPAPSALPASVLKSFATRYPTATRIEWEPENGNTWKVKFFLDSVRWIATFKADGTFISARIKN
jgi:hypothetical protein